MNKLTIWKYIGILFNYIFNLRNRYYQWNILLSRNPNSDHDGNLVDLSLVYIWCIWKIIIDVFITLCNKIIFSSWILFLMIYQSWLFQSKNYMSVTTKKLRIPSCRLDVSESVCKETSKSIVWRCQTNISADLLVLVIIFCKKGKKTQIKSKK